MKQYVVNFFKFEKIYETVEQSEDDLDLIQPLQDVGLIRKVYHYLFRFTIDTDMMPNNFWLDHSIRTWFEAAKEAGFELVNVVLPEYETKHDGRGKTYRASIDFTCPFDKDETESILAGDDDRVEEDPSIIGLSTDYVLKLTKITHN